MVVESISMKQTGREARATSDPTGTGITRREALKRGTLLSLGLVWVTPQMSSYAMTAQFAQATSPVPETTEPEVSDTIEIEDEVEDVEVENGEEVVSSEIEDEVEDVEVENGEEVVSGEIEDEVEDVEVENGEEVVSGELPFTGFPLEQLLPIAGGALATGAAVVRAARERKEPADPGQDRTGDV